MSYLAAPTETSWLQAAERGADWWIAHVPNDHVAFWDFDDPAIPIPSATLQRRRWRQARC
jgi:unsaturated chondroitin disaccharide hydrolase